MRTLSRPMFNMGGPIKQGIMNGIREPHQAGQIVGKIAPYAAKAFQKVKGLFGKTVPVRHTPITRVTTPGTTPGTIHKGYPGSIPGSKWQPGKEVTEQIFAPSKVGKYIAGTPEAQILKGLYQGKGLITKPIKWGATQVVKSPIIMGGLVWTGVSWLRKDGSPADKDEIELNKAQHGPFDHTEKKVKTKEAAAAFAKSQREDRVNKYLDIMGYDQSKKLAIADALIDASKIVGERGTLDLKNISQELISPVIQATSKRLDKPQQIREAVGLMATKAELEKDISKEKDALAKSLTMKQIELADRKLEQGFETDIRDLLLTARTPPNKKQLEQYARLTADKYGETFTVVEGEGDIKGDGIYMVEGTILRVTDGVPKRIV